MELHCFKHCDRVNEVIKLECSWSDKLVEDNIKLHNQQYDAFQMCLKLENRVTQLQDALKAERELNTKMYYELDYPNSAEESVFVDETPSDFLQGIKKDSTNDQEKNCYLEKSNAKLLREIGVASSAFFDSQQHINETYEIFLKMSNSLAVLNQQFFHKYRNEDYESQRKPDPQIAELTNQLDKINRTVEICKDKQRKARIHFEHSEREGELLKTRLQKDDEVLKRDLEEAKSDYSRRRQQRIEDYKEFGSKMADLRKQVNALKKMKK